MSSLGYLSAFPDEEERLYPPLTYLEPKGRPQKIDVKVPAPFEPRTTQTLC